MRSSPRWVGSHLEVSALPALPKVALAAIVCVSMWRAFLGAPAPANHRAAARLLLVVTAACYAGGAAVVASGADVPYDQLKEMDDANPEFSRTDVSLIIGANDVTNPDARNKADSPIYGMPILNVDDSRSVIVLKRSMNSGFAGIDNPLFYNEKTAMLFGDAKSSVSEITGELSEL